MTDLLDEKIGKATFKKFLVELNKRESPTLDLVLFIPPLQLLFFFDENPEIVFKNELSNILQQKAGAKYSQKGGFNQLFLVLLFIVWHFGMSSVLDARELQERRDLNVQQRKLIEASFASREAGWFWQFFGDAHTEASTHQYHQEVNANEIEAAEISQGFSMIETEIRTEFNAAAANSASARTTEIQAMTLNDALQEIQSSKKWQIISAILMTFIGTAVLSLGMFWQLFKNVLLPAHRERLQLQHEAGRNGLQFDHERRLPVVGDYRNPPVQDGAPIYRGPPRRIEGPQGPPQGPQGPSGGRNRNKKSKTRRRTKKNKRY